MTDEEREEAIKERAEQIYCMRVAMGPQLKKASDDELFDYYVETAAQSLLAAECFQDVAEEWGDASEDGNSSE